MHLSCNLENVTSILLICSKIGLKMNRIIIVNCFIMQLEDEPVNKNLSVYHIGRYVESDEIVKRR